MRRKYVKPMYPAPSWWNKKCPICGKDPYPYITACKGKCLKEYRSQEGASEVIDTQQHYGGIIEGISLEIKL